MKEKKIVMIVSGGSYIPPEVMFQTYTESEVEEMGYTDFESYYEETVEEMCNEHAQAGASTVIMSVDNFYDMIRPHIKDIPPQVYTLFWLTGDTSLVYGNSIEDAFSNGGYGAGAVGALYFYHRGDVRDKYEWDGDQRSWKKKQ